MDIHTTNNMLQHFYHDQTQKKRQTYLWWGFLWAAEVEREACGKAGQGLTRTHTQESALAKWLREDRKFSPARLKGTDFHKHTETKASGRTQFPTGRRQALVLEILKHVFKHVRTAVDFSLCSSAQAWRTPFTDMNKVTQGGHSLAEYLLQLHHRRSEVPLLLSYTEGC